jgi:Zinc dependent phospholipase C.
MKKGFKVLFCYVCALLMISSNITVFAASKKKVADGLPQQVIDIVNGSDKIYGEGAPLSPEIIDTTDGEVSVNFVSGGVDHTHQYIVASALTILYNKSGNSVMNSEANSLEMLANTDWPDRLGNETDLGTFAGHFYNPNTGLNWLGQSSPTAKTRAVEYFNSAVASYKAGNITDAFKYIGRGTHYVSDANEPHHASNLTALNSNHTEFEEYVDTNRTSFYISGNTLADSIYQTAVNSSVDNLVHTSALRANALAGQAQQTSTYFAAANGSVKSAITTATQYLYKFGKTVGIY